jgi:antitoxin YefM
MDALTYTNVRQNFKQAMDQVCDDHTPIIITRQNARPVVMMSLEDYNSTQETLYLMKSPTNAGRLLKAVAEAKANNLITPEIEL